MPTNLPTNVAPGDGNHAVLHNQANAAINDVDARLLALVATGPQTRGQVLDLFIAAGARNYTNLVTDPVPQTAAPYSAYAGAGGAVSPNVLAGQYFFMQWTTASTAAPGGAIIGSKPAYRLVPVIGIPLFAAGEVWVSKAQTMQISIEWYNAGGRISQSFSTPVAVPAGTWTKLTYLTPENAPAGATYVVVSFYGAPAGTAWAVGDTLRLRNTIAASSAIALPSFSGISPNARWNGVANDSTSTAVILS